MAAKCVQWAASSVMMPPHAHLAKREPYKFQENASNAHKTAINVRMGQPAQPATEATQNKMIILAFFSNVRMKDVFLAMKRTIQNAYQPSLAMP